MVDEPSAFTKPHEVFAEIGVATKFRPPAQVAICFSPSLVLSFSREVRAGRGEDGEEPSNRRLNRRLGLCSLAAATSARADTP
jgi:hypothetical protein